MANARLIDHAIYPRQALSEARTAYKDYCTIRVEPAGGHRATLTIDVLPEHSTKEREIVLSFMNYMLDKALEQQLASL
jgi:hypothetical protein